MRYEPYTLGAVHVVLAPQRPLPFFPPHLAFDNLKLPVRPLPRR